MKRWTLGLCLVLPITVLPITTSVAESLEPADSTAVAVERPLFVAISVADLSASVAWYERVMGLEVQRSIDLDERGIRIRLLRGQSTFLELVEDRTSRSAEELDPSIERIAQVRGVYKIGWLVDDLDEAVARLEALGVPLRGKIITEPDGSFRSLQVEDPDGNVIQLFEDGS